MKTVILKVEITIELPINVINKGAVLAASKSFFQQLLWKPNYLSAFNWPNLEVVVEREKLIVG